ncbi:DUF3472 domain-containing protein [Algoriphagus sp.]|uniref:DUF3472 domain-containing protein n=1 Tax=Algoriphagus sp. TaxID=1872435 RepID=UPI00328A07A3
MNLRPTLLFFLLISHVAFSSSLQSRSANNTTVIPLGGNTYQTKGTLTEKIKADGITAWVNKDTEFSVFIGSDQAATLDLELDIFPQSYQSKISVELNGQKHIVNLSSGSSTTLNVGEFNLINGYNEIKLVGLEKAGHDFAKIKSIQLKSAQKLNLDFVKDDIDNRFYWGRRGPSVHLSYTLPTDENYQWFYNEVTVPEGSDPIGSYFMANGFAEGYFGIQVNSEMERRILFSVWSPFKTDNPGEIPEEEKIILLKKGEGVYTGEFGNEGSGGQSYLKYTWEAGQTYSFLNSVTPDGKGNTIYTAYFMDPSVGEWMLIASFLRPKTDTWYKRPHSFLENFVPETGYLERTATYGNQWAADTYGNWHELTEAKFTGDDIARRGYRKDFEGGENNGQFYLRNDGFFNGLIELNSLHQRKTNGIPPTINFDKLP